MGDSLGHWEGGTLVIEITNLRFNKQSRCFGTQYDGMSGENLPVTERLTKTGPNAIIYQATVVDPAVYTKLWTSEILWRKSKVRFLNTPVAKETTDWPIFLRARAREKACGESKK